MREPDGWNGIKIGLSDNEKGINWPIDVEQEKLWTDMDK